MARLNPRSQPVPRLGYGEKRHLFAHARDDEQLPARTLEVVAVPPAISAPERTVEPRHAGKIGWPEVFEANPFTRRQVEAIDRRGQLGEIRHDHFSTVRRP